MILSNWGESAAIWRTLRVLSYTLYKVSLYFTNWDIGEQRGGADASIYFSHECINEYRHLLYRKTKTNTNIMQRCISPRNTKRIRKGLKIRCSLKLSTCCHMTRHLRFTIQHEQRFYCNVAFPTIAKQ